MDLKQHFKKENLCTKLNETNKKDSKGNKNPNKYPDPPIQVLKIKLKKSASQKSQTFVKCS
jgi:hypothetical protein